MTQMRIIFKTLHRMKSSRPWECLCAADNSAYQLTFFVCRKALNAHKLTNLLEAENINWKEGEQWRDLEGLSEGLFEGRFRWVIALRTWIIAIIWLKREFTSVSLWMWKNSSIINWVSGMQTHFSAIFQTTSLHWDWRHPHKSPKTNWFMMGGRKKSA